MISYKFFSDMPRAEFDAKFGLGRFLTPNRDLPDAPWASKELPDAPWVKTEILSDDGRPDWRRRYRNLSVILLPPCIVLIVGIGLFWAAQGFRHQRER